MTRLHRAVCPATNYWPRCAGGVPLVPLCGCVVVLLGPQRNPQLFYYYSVHRLRRHPILCTRRAAPHDIVRILGGTVFKDSPYHRRVHVHPSCGDLHGIRALCTSTRTQRTAHTVSHQTLATPHARVASSVLVTL